MNGIGGWWRAMLGTYVCSCLLTIRDRRNAVCIRHLHSIRGIVRGHVGVNRVLEQQLCNVFILHKRQQCFDPREQISFSADISRHKECTFVTIVADQQPLSVDLPCVELLRGLLLDVLSIGDWQERPCAVEAACGNLDIGLLERLRVFAEEAPEDVLPRVSVSGTIEAASLGSKGIVRLRGFKVFVSELKREVGASGDEVGEKRSAQSTTLAESVEHNRACTC